MRHFAFALLLGVSAQACRRDSAAGTDASTPMLDAAAADSGTYEPAKLHPRACASSAVPALPVPGCEACQPDEFCEHVSVHGRDVGRCQKSTCARDADCPGALCTCGPPHRCTAGNCRDADDCGGRECASNRGVHGHGSGTFCRTAQDTCSAHASCGPGRECVYVGDRWGCREAAPAPPPG